MGVPDQVARNICDLFRNRVIFVRSNKNSLIGPRMTSIGIPQGSTLSPLLFNMYCVDLYRMWSPNINACQYADDLCIYTTDKSTKLVLQQLKAKFKIIKRWLFDNGFDLSVDKLQTIFFSRHRDLPTGSLRWMGVELKITSEISYLGMILDSKLRWRPHIEKLIGRCERGINLIRMISRVNWGADMHSNLKIYKTYVRSLLDYGCILYGCASNSNLKRLDAVSNKALRLCMGAMCSSPGDVVQVEAREPPLSIRRNFLASKFVLKCKSQNSKILPKLSELAVQDLVNLYWRLKNAPPFATASRNLSDIAILRESAISKDINYTDYISEIQVTFPPYQGISSLDNLLHQSIIRTHQHALFIYTDGSKGENGCGCAYLIQPSGQQNVFKLNGNASIFTAEATAIAYALREIHVVVTKKLVVMSDSLSVLKALDNKTNFYSTNPYILDILTNVARLRKEGIEIYFYWIKAHIGISHNETVDKLAKGAVESGIILNIPQSKQDETAFMKQQILRTQWEAEWRERCLRRPTQYTYPYNALNNNQSVLL
ncbi:hypothetical protein PPYR_05842 [Photinus pyralis]|uniref:Reverse transcriptase domain-containing protein n=1 Tax=Photinus pyralis TaxID=7054 RepID=A0A5N4AW79_PHOPY|nr:hypothetical protein PPYR_08418 [Photinus pyralis]KAB0801488.1 hypothetical protein PPYR_05842 [Photinus pyralis]